MSSFQNIYQSLGSQFQPYYTAAQAEYGVPASILAAQDYQESTFGTFPTGPGNGGGMAQFTSSTAQSLGYTQQDLQNPVTAIQAQAKYDAQLLAQHGGDMAAALEAYSGNTPGYAQAVIDNASSIQSINTPPIDANGYAPVSSIPGPTLEEQQAGLAAQAKAAQSAPSFSWLNPWPWLKYEGLNIALMAVGIIAIIIVFNSMFKTSIPVPVPVE